MPNAPELTQLTQLTLRRQLIATAQRMTAAGLNKGTAGNLSVRVAAGDAAQAGFLITPTGMDYATLNAEDIVFMRFDGTPVGKRQPSSEWRFHRDVYAARPAAGAILHAKRMKDAVLSTASFS